jgi:hypothetical protein
VLNGVEMYETTLPPMSKTPCPATPLLSILNVQMDNATRE